MKRHSEFSGGSVKGRFINGSHARPLSQPRCPALATQCVFSTLIPIHNQYTACPSMTRPAPAPVQTPALIVKHSPYATHRVPRRIPAQSTESQTRTMTRMLSHGLWSLIMEEVSRFTRPEHPVSCFFRKFSNVADLHSHRLPTFNRGGTMIEHLRPKGRSGERICREIPLLAIPGSRKCA